MPWFEYVCEKCGERVQRHRPVAYRDVAPYHNVEDGCWDGLLRRIAPVRGPGALRWAEEWRQGRAERRRDPRADQPNEDASAQTGA
jgi:hypothetical protein